MRQTTFLILTTFLYACDKGDDSAGESDADTDTDSDTDTDTDTDTDVSIEIAGNWIDASKTTHEITDDTWNLQYSHASTPLVFHISSYDNAADYAIAQNDKANKYDASLWSRFDWSWDAQDLYYCQTTYNAKTEQAAEETPPADSADLTTGCAGFPWSPLTAN